MKNRKLLCLLVSFVLVTTFLLFSCGEDAADSSSDAESGNSFDVSSISEISGQESQSFEESLNGESSDADYQVEITDEMVNAFLKLIGYNTINEYATKNGLTEDLVKSAYVAYGRLGEYILCNMPNLAADTATWSCAAGEYLFTSPYIWKPSMTGLYLYKDGDMIPFDEANERGLFDGEAAYELILNYSGPDHLNKIIVKKFSELSDEVAAFYREHPDGIPDNIAISEQDSNANTQSLSDIYEESLNGESSEPDYQIKMTEEMANAFLKFNGSGEPVSGIADYDYNADYVPFGNLNGYTFCYISPYFASVDANDEFSEYKAGDCIFYCTASGYKSEVSLYLYKDMTFMTFEEAFEKGLFDADDAYNLMQRDFDGKKTICTSVRKMSDD